MLSKKTSKISAIPRPLPFLPPEVKSEILKFCDPQTLRNAGLVSLAFLELSSPFLYRNVVVRGSTVLRELLCLRSDHPQPSIQKHTSLSLIRTLTYHQTRDASYIYQLQNPPRIRSLPSHLLQLNELKIIVDDPVVWERAKPEFEVLLQKFNPRSFVFEVTPYQGFGAYRYDVADMSSISLSSSSSVENWNRLEKLKFVNCFAEWTLARPAFLAVETNPKIKLVYDLSLPQTGQTAYGYLLEDLKGTDQETYWRPRLEQSVAERRLERVEEVEVIVATERASLQVLEGLKGLPILARTTVVVRG